MEEMNHPQTWTELLQIILEKPQERQRIAHEIHVSTLTLSRWVNKESQPRRENLHALARVIPSDFSQLFTHLLSKEFPEFAQTTLVQQQIETEPLPEFYARILSAYAYTPPTLFTQTICDLVLHQAIEHLDPDRKGMSISIVICVLPSQGNTVRSLRTTYGIGTPPWKRDLDQDTMFLGIESLAGAAVSNFHLVHISSRDEHTLFPAHWLQHEQSAVAAPIARKTKIAGCLVVSSTQTKYFTQQLIQLVERYAHIMALAFEPDQFLDMSNIHLQLMPQYDVQLTHFQNFHQRVAQKFTEASQNNQLMTLQKAQESVWQEIEEKLLHYSTSNE
jgi:transcriptional regulator with XRE-family HTH domain